MRHTQCVCTNEIIQTIQNNTRLKTLELFAGSQSFSKVAKDLGFETFTSDIAELDGIDYISDIMNFDTNKVPFIPNIIWASPDCSTWSKVAGNIHFNTKSLTPKTEKAAKGFDIIEKTIEVINHFLRLNPELKYYIENPEGKMQKYLQAGTLFSKIPRLVVLDQCQYGREFQKTTHIFTNDFSWKVRKRCPGLPVCTHQPNLKNQLLGTNTSLGKLGKRKYYERAKIPYQLCLEILIHNINSNKK